MMARGMTVVARGKGHDGGGVMVVTQWWCCEDGAMIMVVH